MTFAEKYPAQAALLKWRYERLKRMVENPRLYRGARMKQARDALVAQEKVCRDLAVPLILDEARSKYTYAPDWRDVSTGRWGARDELVTMAWRGGNCLAACIGSLLGVDIAKVPDPTTVEYRQSGDWLEGYNKRLAEQLGQRLEELPVVCCPPDQTSLWIAGIETASDPHVVCARGWGIIFDPAGLFSGMVPSDRLIQGFALRPTKRLVPYVSLSGSGYAVASA